MFNVLLNLRINKQNEWILRVELHTCDQQQQQHQLIGRDGV